MTSSADSSSKGPAPAFRARLWRRLRPRTWSAWVWVFLIYAVLAVMMMFGLPPWRSRPYRPRARSFQTLIDIHYRLKYEPFFEEHGLPKGHAELVRVFESQGWVGEDDNLSVVDGYFVDAWGEPIIYRKDPEAPRGYYLYSRGPDRIDERGAGDDVAPGIKFAPNDLKYYPNFRQQSAPARP